MAPKNKKNSRKKAKAPKQNTPKVKKYDMGGRVYAEGRSQTVSKPVKAKKPSPAKASGKAPSASASPSGTATRPPERVKVPSGAKPQPSIWEDLANKKAAQARAERVSQRVAQGTARGGTLPQGRTITVEPPMPKTSGQLPAVRGATTPAVRPANLPAVQRPMPSSVAPQVIPEGAMKALPAPKPLPPGPTMPTGAPRVMPRGGAIPAIGGAMGVVGGAELAHQLTPEGIGSKGGGWSPANVIGEQEFRGERITPRDFNTYQGKLAPLGQFGAGVEKMAGDIGQVAGELSTYLPPALGGIRTAQGDVPKADMQELKDQQYQEMFGQDQEGYGYLASGAEQLPQGLPPLQALPAHEPLGDERMYELQKMAKTEPTIEIDKGGRVRANPRYGLPDRPESRLRPIEERLFDVGVRNENIGDMSMAHIMASKFWSDQLGADDRRQAALDDKRYKADLEGLDKWNKTDLETQGLESLISGREAQATANLATASKAPSEIKKNLASIKKLTKETDNILDPDQAISEKAKTDMLAEARAIVLQKMKLQFPELEEGEFDIRSEAEALNQAYATLLEGYKKQENLIAAEKAKPTALAQPPMGRG